MTVEGEDVVIVYKTWKRITRKDIAYNDKVQEYLYEGWFLFWIIPLYIRRVRAR